MCAALILLLGQVWYGWLLAIRQGGYVDTAKGISRDPVAFAISFSSVPGLAGTCDYPSSRSTLYVTQMGFGTNINGDRRNAKVWYIAIGV